MKSSKTVYDFAFLNTSIKDIAEKNKKADFYIQFCILIIDWKTARAAASDFFKNIILFSSCLESCYR